MSILQDFISSDAEISEKHELLRTIIDNLPGCNVFVKDAESRFLISNAAHLRILGAEKLEEISGKTDFDIFPQELAEQYYADEQSIIQSGRPLFNRVEPVVDQAGEHRWYLTNKIPVRDEAEQIVGLVGINLDITELKLLEQQIQALLERRNGQVNLINQTAQAIAAKTDPDIFFREVVTQVQELFEVTYVQLLLFDSMEDTLKLVAGSGDIGEQMMAEGYRISPGSGLIGLAAISGTSALRSDTSTDSSWHPDPHLPDIRSELAVPIKLGNENVEAQLSSLSHFSDSGFDGFAVAATDPTAIAPAAKKAMDKGLPVVACSINLGEGNQTAIVHTDEYDMGYMLGSEAGKWAQKHIPANATVKVGVLSYRITPELIERDRGIVDGIKAVSGRNVEVIGNEMIKGGPELGRLITEKWLESCPDLNMVVSVNDNGALGAYQAFRAAGRDDAEKFFVGGIDAVEEALAAIKKGGAFQATINQLPREMGRLSVRKLVAAIKDLPYEETTLLECTPVTPANIDEFRETASREKSDEKETPTEDVLLDLDLSTIRIGLSVQNLNNPFWNAVADAAKLEAERLGVDLVINDPRPVVGVLDVQSDRAGLLEMDDQQFLEGLCDQIAVAIDSHRAEAERERAKKALAKRAQQMRTVAEVSAATSTLSDSTKLLQRVVDLTKERFGLYHAHIYLLDKTGNLLNLAAGAGEAGRQMVAEEWCIPLKSKQSLVAQVARNQQGEIVNNVQANPNWLPNPLLPDTCAELAVPLIAESRVLGVLDIQADEVDYFTRDDIDVQTALATQVAIAVQNARQVQELTGFTSALTTSTDVSRRLSTILDPDQLMAEVVEQIRSAFGYYYTQIYLYDESGDNLLLTQGTGAAGQTMLARRHSLPKGRGLAGRAADRNTQMLAPDVSRSLGVEIVTHHNIDEVFQRETDRTFEETWYADWIASSFPEIKIAKQLAHHQTIDEKDIQIGYTLHVKNEFSEAMQRGAEAAARDLQVNLEIVGPDHIAEHLPLFEAMLEKGKDGLVTVPYGDERWPDTMQKAIDAGVALVAANLESPLPEITSVVQDTFQSGSILARELIKLLEAGDRTTGHIIVGPGQPDRFSGFDHAMRNTGYTITRIESDVESDDPVAIRAYWHEAIISRTDVIAVIGLTSVDIPVLADLKRDLQADWFIAGYDLNNETIQAIKKGVAHITIAQHPYAQGYLPILALAEKLRRAISLTRWMAEGWLPNPLLPDTKAEAAAPIAVGEQVMGVLDVQHNIAGSLKQSDVDLLQSIADQIAVALQNARLFEQTAQAKEEAEAAKEEAERAKENIEIANKALEVKIWQTSGQAQLNDAMRGEQDVATLANSVVRQLCHYLDAQIGALYLADEDCLKLAGRYAYSNKNGANQFKFGEGLVGQTAIEKEPMIITNVPHNYITVRSSLGETPPRNIMVFPFLYEDQVTGVIEMGTLTEFNQAQLEFLQTVMTNIGIAFNTAQARARINELLAETQQQAEELQAQGEELRVANEELEAQTESLRVSETKLKEKQTELEATNTQLEEKAAALEESSEALKEKQAVLDEHNRELKVAQQELEQKAEELALASKYKSEFLANMSHELRTPLNSLLILARMLADNKDANLTDEQVESAQIIYSGGTDLLNLINDILDLSKVEAGQMLFNFESMPLTDLVSTARMQFDQIAQEKELGFNITLADDLPGRIYTDPQRVKQIVKNLLSNAFKFTKQGSVSLNIYRPDDAVDLSRSGLEPAEAVAIRVTDTGIGMTSDQQEVIFEAFQQADGSTNRQYGGTGLGLSISRELAANLGGQIALESEKGKGSTFTLYLPLEKTTAEREEVVPTSKQKIAAKPKVQQPEPEKPAAKNSSSASPPPESAPALPDDRDTLQEYDRVLLIIEDDPQFAKIMRDFAHNKAFKCLIAGDGKSGLELVRTHQPAAVILDLNLPDISGWEVLQTLKDDPATRHIPVQIMSVEEEVLDAYRKGAMGYLTKPVAQEQLDNTFREIEHFISKEIKTLLLVEDDENSRRSITKLLGGNDVRITEAEQGQQALDLLKTQTFDCIILDLSLPDMTGFEILNKINAEEAIAKCPVIVYTGRDLTPAENDELMKYADRVIVKGVKSPERLLDETALFLHQVVADMPQEKQQTIKQLYNEDELLKDKKVLIVDDDMRNSFALSKLLSDKGIIVKIARDGQKALDLLAEDPHVDLILMDIMMPVMDGYEAIKHIRAQRQFNGLPILALTAKAMKGDREKCLAAGANDYLPKPVDVDRLFSMLRVWLYQ